MKWVNVAFCLGIFTIGVGLGKLNCKVVEVERRVEVNKDYLDLTAPDLQKRLEIVANTLDLTLQSKKEVDEYFLIRKSSRAEKELNDYQSAFKEGYQAGFKDR